MAGTVNTVILIGRLGKDPEIRNTAGGQKIGNMSVATSETWKDKASGERKELTEWHRVVCFNDNITDVIERYVKKGSVIHLQGKLQTRKWTDQSGVEKYSTEVIIPKFGGVLTLLGDAGGGNREAPAERLAAAAKPAATRAPPPDLDDEIPF